MWRVQSSTETCAPIKSWISRNESIKIWSSIWIIQESIKYFTRMGNYWRKNESSLWKLISKVWWPTVSSQENSSYKGVKRWWYSSRRLRRRSWLWQFSMHSYQYVILVGRACIWILISLSSSMEWKKKHSKKFERCYHPQKCTCMRRRQAEDWLWCTRSIAPTSRQYYLDNYGGPWINCNLVNICAWAVYAGIHR